PALALSLAGDPEGPWRWEMAVSFAAENLGGMLAGWKPESFINVNIPNRDEKPEAIVRASLARRLYGDRIETVCEPGGIMRCVPRLDAIGAVPMIGSDYEAVARGCASLSDVFAHPALLQEARPGA
ncbi:MAG: hypothetical protein FWE09_01610, partial [Treponema sp.]|nr:hypothetical protein [Treponema sp.]